MRKWLSVSMVCLLFCASGIPVQAQEQKTIHITVHAAQDEKIPCPGSVYEVYQDKDAKELAVDEKGGPVLLTTDEQGKGELTSSGSPLYLKMKTPAKGYYAEEAVTEAADEMTLVQWQIRFAFTSWERIPEMQLRQEDGSLIPLEQAEAGRTYLAVEADSPDYHAAAPVPVSIPRYRDEKNDPLYVTTEDVTFGNADFSFLDEKEIISGVKYSIYQDEACTKKAVDVFGKEAQNVTEKEAFRVSLLPGKYYLKIMDLPMKYAVNENVIPFDVLPQKDAEVKTPLTEIMMKVMVVDGATGNPMQADITCMQEKTVLPSAAEYPVEREKKYLIHAVPADAGYFAIPDQEAAVPKDASKDLLVTLTAVPFDVHVKGISLSAGNDVDLKYEIRDEKGNVLRAVTAGSTVIFHETSCQEGYEPASDQSLTVPLTSDQPMAYEIVFAHVPYVQAAVNAPAGTAVSLFNDPSCSEAAMDRFGHPAQGTADASMQLSFSMYEGTYYAKEEDTPEGYWPDASIRKIVCCRSENARAETSFHNQKITMAVFSTKDGEPYGGAVYDLLENGEVLMEFSSTGEDVIPSLIKAGHRYEVRVVKADEGLRYVKSQEVTVPAEAGSVSAAFAFEPYVTLTLSTDQKTAVKGALFMDQEGTQKAVDIDGKPCDFSLSLTETSLKMRPGVYWFRSEPSPHYYQNVMQISAAEEIKHAAARIHMEEVKVTVEIVNEAEQHTMELIDGSGTLIKTWNSDGGAEEISSQKLAPGGSYVVKDKDTGEETEFTMPQQEPSQAASRQGGAERNGS
jgi:hypothetical protein